MFTWVVLFLLGSSALPIVTGRGESTIFGSQEEEELLCKGCKATKVVKLGGGATPQNLPVLVYATWPGNQLKDGECGPKETCTPYRDKCGFNTNIKLHYKYGQHADGKVDWKLNGDSPKIKEGNVLMKGNDTKVITWHRGDGATEWNCGSSLVLTLAWTLNAVPSNETITYKCGECKK